MSAARRRSSSASGVHESDNVADRAVMLERMTQSYRSIDVVPRAAPDATPHDRSGGFEIAKDLKDRAFRDSDELGKVANPGLGLPRDRDEHVRMVAKKRPGSSDGRLDGWHVPCYLLHEI
jgi:hypothetical protein